MTTAAIPPSGALNTTLRAAARRIRALLLLRYSARALCVGAFVGLVLVGLSKLRLFETPSGWITGGIVAFALLVSVGMAFAKRLTELDVARLTERRADLKERLSSAVEFQAKGVNLADSFYGEQWSDAERHAAGVDVRTLYPARFPRELAIGLSLTLGLFLFYFLPTLPAFWSPQQKQDAADVKKQGIQIVKLAQDTQKAAEQQKLDETKKAAEEAKKLGEAMRKGELSKKKSLVEMEKLTRKMEEAQKRMASTLPQKSMEQAKSEFKRSLDQVQKEVEKEQEKKRQDAARQPSPGQKPQKPGEKAGEKKPENKSEQMKQAQKALEQMAQAMAEQSPQGMQKAMEKIAEQMQSGKMSKEEMKQLQQALQQLAQALKNTNMDLSAKQMEQMAQAMQQAMNNLDPNALSQLAGMCKNIGKGMGQGMDGMKMELDMKMLQELSEAMKNGRLTMCMGNKPGFGGKGPGRGYGATGDPKAAMKDPGATKPRLMAMGKNPNGKGIGKSGSAKEFAKYLAQGAAPAKHLPNGKIAGIRSENGNELQLSMTGDPEASRSNAPYYQVYRAGKKAAESTLNKESIPASYKKQVRDYFDSIKP